MKRSLYSPLFGLLLLGLYIITIWTTFSPHTSRDSYSHFFDYNLNAYSTAFILFNIIFGFALGIMHIQKERQNNGSWRFKYVRFFVIGIPLMILSMGMYIHFDLGVFRFLYFAQGVVAMSITESVGWYYSVAFLLSCGYIFQISLGYLISKCIYKADKA